MGRVFNSKQNMALRSWMLVKEVGSASFAFGILHDILQSGPIDIHCHRHHDTLEMGVYSYFTNSLSQGANTVIRVSAGHTTVHKRNCVTSFQVTPGRVIEQMCTLSL